jgi:hypothetical protein
VKKASAYAGINLQLVTGNPSLQDYVHTQQKDIGLLEASIMSTENNHYNRRVAISERFATAWRNVRECNFFHLEEMCN